MPKMNVSELEDAMDPRETSDGETDWLQDEIERIRAADRIRHQENQVQLHLASVLEAKAGVFLADAGKETKKAVDILNRELEKDDQKRHLTVKTRPHAITVGGIGSTVTATLESGGVVRFTAESGHAHLHTRVHTLELAVDHHDLVYCCHAEGRGPDTVTKALLGPFLSAFREGA